MIGKLTKGMKFLQRSSADPHERSSDTFHARVALNKHHATGQTAWSSTSVPIATTGQPASQPVVLSFCVVTRSLGGSLLNSTLDDEYTESQSRDCTCTAAADDYLGDGQSDQVKAAAEEGWRLSLVEWIHRVIASIQSIQLL